MFPLTGSLTSKLAKPVAALQTPRHPQKPMIFLPKSAFLAIFGYFSAFFSILLSLRGEI
jgi:hypothetical protein